MLKNFLLVCASSPKISATSFLSASCTVAKCDGIVLTGDGVLSLVSISIGFNTAVAYISRCLSNALSNFSSGVGGNSKISELVTSKLKSVIKEKKVCCLPTMETNLPVLISSNGVSGEIRITNPSVSEPEMIWPSTFFTITLF